LDGVIAIDRYEKEAFWSQGYLGDEADLFG
jgi:hypothetical protein